jgi:hypothetical protein
MRIRALKDQAGIKDGEIAKVFGNIVYFKNHGQEYVNHCKKYPEWYQEIGDNQLILSELIDGKRYKNLRTGFVGQKDICIDTDTLIRLKPPHQDKCESFDLFTEVPSPKEERPKYTIGVDPAMPGADTTVEVDHVIKEEKPQMMICQKAKECNATCKHRQPHIIISPNKDDIGCLSFEGCGNKCIPYVEKVKTVISDGYEIHYQNQYLDRQQKKESEWERLLKLMELDMTTPSGAKNSLLIECILKELIRRDKEPK